MKDWFYELLLPALALAFTRLIGAFVVSPKLGASSLPISPTAGNTLTPSLVLAGAIKPTSTIGQVVLDLVALRHGDVDNRVLVLKPAMLAPSRALMFPATVTDDTIMSGETLICTITRDDATKEVSEHSVNVVSGQEAETDVIAIQNAVEVPLKPRRNVSSLINAVNDAIDGLEIGGPAQTYGVVFDQTGVGSVKIYRNAVVGVVTAKVADVSQEIPVADASTPSVW